MSLIIDRFQRANETTLLTPWGSDTDTGSGGCGLTSNAAVGTGGVRNTSFHRASQRNYAQITYATVGSTSNDSGPAIHANGLGTWVYGALYADTSIYAAAIYHRDGATDTWNTVFDTGADTGIVPVVGAKLRLYEINGVYVLDYGYGPNWINLVTIAYAGPKGGYDGMFIGTSADTSFSEWANHDPSLFLPDPGIAVQRRRRPSYSRGMTMGLDIREWM